jgi:hypothetical protein
MPREAVEAFERDPVSILRRHTGGGLAEEAQAIMMSGQPGRFALLAAARSATSAQQEQIGRGIGRAYVQCLRGIGSAAKEIRDRVLRSDVTSLNAAFQSEVDVLWTSNSGATISAERPMDEIGTTPTDVYGGSVPSTNLTAQGGAFNLPPLSGPLPDPFEPIK